MAGKIKIKGIKASQQKTLDKSLRHLPGEITTFDAGDPERIHMHDPDHVRKTLAKQYAKKLAATLSPLKKARAAIMARFTQLSEDPFRFKTIDQEVVDLWRAKTILAWLNKTAIRDELCHLWFPKENNGWCCELRTGPPPPREDRPKHLQNLNLELQVLDWSARMRDIVKSVGVNVTDALEEISVRIANQKARESIEKAAREANQG